MLEYRLFCFDEKGGRSAERALCAKDDADQLMSGLLKKFNAVTGLSGWLDPAQRH